MKIYIVTAATVLLFSILTVFSMDNSNYLQFQDLLKSAASDAANSAAMFYDEDSFSIGTRAFNKTDGNAIILKVLSDTLPVDENLTIHDNNYIGGTLRYTTYYFDSTEEMMIYKDGTFLLKEDISFPYSFKEDATDYEMTVTKPTIIITIDAGEFNYSLPILSDPEAIRTSGYEYVEL